MSDHQKNGYEIHLRKAYQCVAPPSTYIVVQGESGLFYLVRLRQIGEFMRLESLVLNGRLISSNSYNDMLSFLQYVRQLRSRIAYIPLAIQLVD